MFWARLAVSMVLEFVKDAINRQLMTVELLDGTMNFGTAGKAPDRFQLAGEQGVNLIAGNDIAGIGAGNKEFQGRRRRN